jgi:UMF1 family MFS transporter
VWWLVFSLPILRVVPEPPRRILAGEERFTALQASFNRLARTFREIRNFRDLFVFLVAFWFYNNGIGTIILMATIYGAEIGLGQTVLIGTLLMVQFLGVPFAFAFGWLAKRIGTKPAIYLALAIYTVIAIAGYFMQVEWHFLALGAGVATVQGGSQALSRSLMGRLVPRSKSAEFFGFFSVSEKFASIAGPALFGVVSQIMGESRLSIVSLIIFFIAGGLILTRVDVQRGIAHADAEEAAYLKLSQA